MKTIRFTINEIFENIKKLVSMTTEETLVVTIDDTGKLMMFNTKSTSADSIAHQIMTNINLAKAEMTKI